MKYFGTDGIRGSFGKTPITKDFFYHLGRALGVFLDQLSISNNREVFLGRDTRDSGLGLEIAFAHGISEFGYQVYSLGVVPTPAISRYVNESQGTLGVAITASHNSSSDNGIKFFDSRGFKLSIDQETAIERCVETLERVQIPTYFNRIVSTSNGSANYINRIREPFSKLCLKGKKIILDCSNGATSITSPKIIKTLGADLLTLNYQPNGSNINLECGSENPEKITQTVIDQKAVIGLAHDGDGDRVIFCDETGSLVNGDEILGILAIAQKRNVPTFETLVVTQQSNSGLDASLKKKGIKVIRTDIGDRFVAAKMREIGSSVGGESSGHIILNDFSPTGDGIVAALRVLTIMQQKDMPLSELRKDINLYPQLNKNIQVKQKLPLESCKPILDSQKEIEKSFNKRGRVLIRYSGTEPKLRILVECPEKHLAIIAMEKLTTASLQCLT